MNRLAKTVSRRAFLKATGLGVTGAVLAACAPAAPAAAPGASQQSTTPAEAPAAEAKAETVIHFWHWDNFVIDPYMKEGELFTKQNPNVKVSVELVPWGEYSPKTGAAIAAGTPPEHVGTAGEHFTNLAGAGQLMELKPLIDRDKFDMSDFNDRNLKQHSWKGKLVSIPYGVDAQCWFYNVDEFKKQGLKTPTEMWKEGTWTWDEALILAEKLTTGSGTDKQWGSGGVNIGSAFDFPTYIYANGGDLFDAAFTKSTIEDPKSVAAYEFAYNMRKFAPTPQDGQSGAPQSGKVMMWQDWENWYQLNIGRVPFKYSVAPLPAPPDTKTHMFTGDAPGFAIPNGVKPVDAVWEWIKFLLTPESLDRLFQQVNQPPPRLSMFKDAGLWKKNPAIDNPELLWELQNARWKNFRNNPKMSNFNEIWKGHQEEMSLVWADKQSLKDGIAKTAAHFNKLAKEGDIDTDSN